MKARPLEKRDLAVLREIYARLPYRFDDGFPDFLSRDYEAAEVVVDADDRPIAVCAAKRAIEMVVVCDPRRPVLIRLQAFALMHEGFRKLLRGLGFTEAFAFVPPGIEQTHGRTMQKRFGWLRAWAAYRIQ